MDCWSNSPDIFSLLADKKLLESIVKISVAHLDHRDIQRIRNRGDGKGLLMAQYLASRGFLSSAHLLIHFEKAHVQYFKQ